MGEKYNSVSEMIGGVSKDNSHKELVDKQIKERSLSKFLFCLRCGHGLSQKELAEKIGCSQSRISKIEHARDVDLTIQDLVDYGKALKLQVEIGYRNPSAKIVDLIKYHAFKIKAYLNELNGLVKDDEALRKSIKTFHLEAFFNIGKIIWDSLSQIKLDIKDKECKKDTNTIHISVPLDKDKCAEIAPLCSHLSGKC
jgi:transcriptional regulator with XRE-family HTH domain